MIVVKYYGGVTTTKPPEPHAIFRGDDIRFLLMKKTAGNTNSPLITARQNSRLPVELRSCLRHRDRVRDPVYQC